MGINLDDIKDRSAIAQLARYSGRNPYILNLQHELNRKGKLVLTDNQSKYIINNFEKEPIKINRVLEISEYLATEFQKREGLNFLPKKILVQFILGETDKTYHIYGKLTQKQEKSGMYWIPKTQLLDDPFYISADVDVDFEKYVKLDTLHRVPYEHQEESIKFLLSREGSILALDMGLGKTMCAIIAALETGVDKILVVCPSSLKINWEREINYFCDYTSIISGKKWEPNKFTIINYDILKNFHTVPKGKKKKSDDIEIRFKTDIKDHQFDLVIIDEAHFLKNPKSIRGKIMTDLCVSHGIEKVWLLTGTPIANRPMDFYNLLKLIKAPIADNWVYYARRYCDGKKFYKTKPNGRKQQIWLTGGASNLGELAQKTKNVILRRKKEDVLDMPAKTIIPVLHDLSKSEWVEHDSLWDDYIEMKREKGESTCLQKDLVELILLRKFIAMTAIPKSIELAESAIEQEQKVVIFTNFTDELLELHEYFGISSVIHYGQMTDKEKQHSIDQFMKNDKKTVFIGNIKSAGVGITLTAANIVIFNSFDWVTGNNEQAADRCHRIGQTKNVSVYYQLFANTISTRMWVTLQNKKDVINQVLLEENNPSEEEEAILKYIKEIEGLEYE